MKMDWDFNDIYDFDEEFFDSIPIEIQFRALRLYKKKDVDKLKEIINNLADEYSKQDYIYITALYTYLTDKSNAKDIILKSLEKYKYNDLPFIREIAMYLAISLLDFYQEKDKLEKIYSFILKESYEIAKREESINKDILNIALNAKEWIENNIKLDETDEKILNFIMFYLIENLSMSGLLEKDKQKIFQIYTKALWKLREYIDFDKTFGPLLKGIG
jgi:hypothetical protein